MRVDRRFLLAVLWLVLLTSGSGSAGNDGLELEALHSAEQLTQEVYAAYAAEQFEDVYRWMAPEIREVMTKKQYTEYQEHHFERLRLALTDIEVSDSDTAERPPRGLRTLIDDAYDAYLTVKVQYTASFYALGSQRTETIDKTVYWAAVYEEPDQVTVYLLWDPEDVLEEESYQ